MKAMVIYVPVPHPGYLALFERHPFADIILLSSETIKPFSETIADQLSRDFHCLPVQDVAVFLHYKYPAINIRPFDGLDSLKQYDRIVMPDEDVSLVLKQQIDFAEIELDNAFLRYNWNNVNVPKAVTPDCKVSYDELDRQFMRQAEMASEKSSDFWRHVGSVIPLEDGFLAAFNEHMPTAHEPYIYGDMRLIMKPGEKPEICGALHAEKGVFAQALRLGISVEGKDMYVTTFPCIACAQMIVRVGIKRLFFKEGYSNQNAKELFQLAGIEIVQVK